MALKSNKYGAMSKDNSDFITPEKIKELKSLDKFIMKEEVEVITIGNPSIGKRCAKELTMKEEKKILIDSFQKWLDTNPDPSIVALECANIAEKYANERGMRYKGALLGKTYTMTETAKVLYTDEFYEATKINFENFRIHIKELYKNNY